MSDANKTHQFEVLDALRGFCAIAVVILHFSENYIRLYDFRLLPHGCLPVEYFFILTGFMLVFAYDGRWAKGMTIGAFFRRRLVRLHPLIVIGSVIGAASYVFAAPYFDKQMHMTVTLGQLPLLTLWCCTMLPAPRLLGWGLLHPLQGALWTMFYIYLANVLYALFLRRFKTWALALLALGGVFLTYRFGLLTGGFHCGPQWSWWWGDGPVTLKGIWDSNNMGAVARMTFPVLAGMVIARKGWRIRSGGWGLWACIAILTAIFVAPEFRPNKLLNGLFESSAVVFGMPLVLLIGLGGEIRNARLAAVCRFLGRFSFPLYCTHYALTVVQRLWRDTHLDLPWPWHLASILAFALFAVINAYVAMLLSDWISSKMRK